MKEPKIIFTKHFNNNTHSQQPTKYRSTLATKTLVLKKAKDTTGDFLGPLEPRPLTGLSFDTYF